MILLKARLDSLLLINVVFGVLLLLLRWLRDLIWQQGVSFSLTIYLPENLGCNVSHKWFTYLLILRGAVIQMYRWRLPSQPSPHNTKCNGLSGMLLSLASVTSISRRCISGCQKTQHNQAKTDYFLLVLCCLFWIGHCFGFNAHLSFGRTMRWCSRAWPTSRRSIASSAWPSRDLETVYVIWNPLQKLRWGRGTALFKVWYLLYSEEMSRQL